MNQRVFLDQVKRAFAYLSADFDFRVTDERFDANFFGNGLVEFRSSDTGVLVTLDRGQIWVSVGPVQGSRDSWFGLPILQDYFAPSVAEEAYHFPEEWDDYDEMVRSQIRRVADRLRRHAAPALTSGFSGWKNLEETRSRRPATSYRALTGRDLPSPQS